MIIGLNYSKLEDCVRKDITLPPHLKTKEDKSYLSMNGKEFSFSYFAVGLPSGLISKLVSNVSDKTSSGYYTERETWGNMQKLFTSIDNKHTGALNLFTVEEISLLKNSILPYRFSKYRTQALEKLSRIVKILDTDGQKISKIEVASYKIDIEDVDNESHYEINLLIENKIIEFKLCFPNYNVLEDKLFYDFIIGNEDDHVIWYKPDPWEQYGYYGKEITYELDENIIIKEIFKIIKDTKNYIIDYLKKEKAREIVFETKSGKVRSVIERKDIDFINTHRITEKKLTKELIESNAVIVPASFGHNIYLAEGIYYCKPYRFFRTEVQFMSFYYANKVCVEIPQILGYIRDFNVFTDNPDNFTNVNKEDSETYQRFVSLISVLKQDMSNNERRDYYILSKKENQRTVILKKEIPNDLRNYRGRRYAYARGQRYTTMYRLLLAEGTSEL